MLHTHTHAADTHRHSRTNASFTHTHVHVAKIHKKNVQSKQTRRGLTANCRDNTNWFDPSLLLGKEICTTVRHIYTHTHTRVNMHSKSCTVRRCNTVRAHIYETV